MSVINYDDLIVHKGHKIEVVTYGFEDSDVNVAIECEDCSEVLLDFDREGLNENDRIASELDVSDSRRKI